MAAVKTAVDGLGGPRRRRPRSSSGSAPATCATACGIEHFDVVGAALLWTLEQGLGERFTPAVRDAWVAAWDVIAGAMRDGHAPGRGRPRARSRSPPDEPGVVSRSGRAGRAGAGAGARRSTSAAAAIITSATRL